MHHQAAVNSPVATDTRRSYRWRRDAPGHCLVTEQLLTSELLKVHPNPVNDLILVMPAALDDAATSMAMDVFRQSLCDQVVLVFQVVLSQRKITY